MKGSVVLCVTKLQPKEASFVYSFTSELRLIPVQLARFFFETLASIANPIMVRYHCEARELQKAFVALWYFKISSCIKG